jgi:hypothetical protein
MTRSQFIKNVIGIFGIAKIPLELGIEYEKIYMLPFFVRGFQYYEGPNIIDKINELGLLTMVREPENKFDEKAIALYFEDYKIGYVPREDNTILAKILDADLLSLQVEITHIEPNAADWEKIHAVIYALKEKKTKTPDYLLHVKVPKYYTLKKGKNKYKRFYYEENNLITAHEFYNNLIENSSNDRIYDIIHDTFDNFEELEYAVNNSRIIFNTNLVEKKYSDLLSEKIHQTPIILNKIFETEGYIIANVNELATIPDKIERFVKMIDKKGAVFYEIILT